jgi:hypothetical protein
VKIPGVCLPPSVLGIDSPVTLCSLPNQIFVIIIYFIKKFKVIKNQMYT